jgi:hypothetical protein
MAEPSLADVVERLAEAGDVPQLLVKLDRCYRMTSPELR